MGYNSVVDNMGLSSFV